MVALPMGWYLPWQGTAGAQAGLQGTGVSVPFFSGSLRWSWNSGGHQPYCLPGGLTNPEATAGLHEGTWGSRQVCAQAQGMQGLKPSRLVRRRSHW